jgi:hypothetical protein
MSNGLRSIPHNYASSLLCGVAFANPLGWTTKNRRLFQLPTDFLICALASLVVGAKGGASRRPRQCRRPQRRGQYSIVDEVSYAAFIAQAWNTRMA